LIRANADAQIVGVGCTPIDPMGAVGNDMISGKTGLMGIGPGLIFTREWTGFVYQINHVIIEQPHALIIGMRRVEVKQSTHQNPPPDIRMQR